MEHEWIAIVWLILLRWEWIIALWHGRQWGWVDYFHIAVRNRNSSIVCSEGCVADSTGVWSTGGDMIEFRTLSAAHGVGAISNCHSHRDITGQP
jgi:hypothetical protein